ncbi:albusnodin/ikarugamycin family macrolactam cyclase [Antribacter gilvus]|uniref:albusnodin/ikarugamycin family macrolactam cyclase n=1 Tax=Antribacter gilvus TaxID=2304675 RepID=UPI000F779290|nr:albusnodin/ikarugamycin family macrolactam cyclase [Antribacter gilvus]
MRWFAGFHGTSPEPRRPLDGQQLWAVGDSCAWAVGAFPGAVLQAASTPVRDVLIIGACSAGHDDLDRLASHGVPDDVVTRWSGAYAVVERTAAATTIWTDLTNAVPIYVHQADDGLYWATSSRHLAGLTTGRLDLPRIAAELLAPASTLLSADRSYFDDVRLLPSGHRARVSGRTAHRRAVWAPITRPVDAAVALRRELTSAVRFRVTGATSPSSDLSGGLDSTALTLLAAEALSPDRSVAAFTVHRQTHTPAGDLLYALDAATRPGIRHHPLPLPADQQPYGRLNQLPPTDEPAPSAKAYARFAFQLDAMHDLVASDAHLTGDGGDAVLMTPLAWIGDLLSRGLIARAVSEAVRFARIRQTTPRAILERAAAYVRPQPGDVLSVQARIWRGERVSARASRTAREWIAPALTPAWLTDETRRLAADIADQAAYDAQPIAPGNASRHLIANAAADVGRTAFADAQLADHHGITLHNPFVDSRVLDACLSVSVPDLPGPSEYKPVLRDALAGLYPQSLRARTTKGAFTSDYFQGLRANLPALLDLAGGRLADHGLVDAARLRAVLRSAATGAAVPLYRLDTVLGIEAWISALESEPAPTWSAPTHSTQAVTTP